MKTSVVTGKWPEQAQELLVLLRCAARAQGDPNELLRRLAAMGRECERDPDILRGTAELLERGWANSARAFVEDVVTHLIETGRPVPNASELAEITDVEPRTVRRVLAQLGVNSPRGRPRRKTDTDS